MVIWDVYHYIYGKLAGWKSAKWFCREKSRLVSSCAVNLSGKKEKILNKDQLIKIVQAEFDHSRKIATTPIMYGDIANTTDEVLEASLHLEKNLNEQIAYLKSEGFEPGRFLELVDKEERILAGYQEKLIKL